MKNKYKVIFTLFIGLFFAFDVNGQQIITGTVLEKGTDLGLPGVNITGGNPARTYGVTGINGAFSINVPSDITLSFKFLGFKSVSQKVDGSTTTLKIYMDYEQNVLNETVVVGYQTRTRETMTGSSVVITAADIQDAPAANVMDLLQGRVAGLNIQQNVGTPGMRGSAVIRGLSSINVTGSGADAFLTPTSPLFIVDGVPVDDNSGYEYGFEQAGPGISPISLIPVEDIERIEVLKDAQATSLYGSKGAYGVILITTKRGESKVPIIRYDTKVFLSTPPNLRQVIGGMDERMMRIDQIMKYDTSYYNALHLINSTNYLSDSLNAYWNNNTDWQSYFYRQTFNQTHNLSVSGGDQEFNYKVNTGYYGEKGIVENTGFSRYSLNMNMQYQPSNKFRLFAAVNTALGNNSKGSGSSLRQTGVASGGSASSLLPAPSQYTASNDLLGAINIDNNNRTSNLTSQLELSYEPIQGIRGSTTFSYNYTTGLEERISPAYLNNNFAEVYSYNDRKTTLYNRNLISYVKSWEDIHTLNLNIFNEIDINTNRADAIKQVSTPNDQIQGPIGYDWFNSRGGTLNNISDRRSVAFAGSASYNFAKKYVLDLSYRLDGSSTNGPESPYRQNPSVGFRWNFNKESLFENAYWLDFGSLRFSWGKNIVPTGSIFDVYGKYSGGGMFNNNPTVSLDMNSVPNLSLIPSTTTQLNGGIDLGIFNGKLNLTFDTYYKQVDAQLSLKEIANHNAFKNVSTNETSLVNYGYELGLTMRPLSAASAVDWTVSVNGAINKDIMAALPDNVRQIIRMDPSVQNLAILSRLGMNALSNVLLHTKGVFSTNGDVPVDPLTGLRYRSGSAVIEESFFRAGDPYFTDLNGDYILNEDDYVIVGNSQPSFSGGFNSFLQYKGFNLTVNGSVTLRRDIINTALAQRFQGFSNPTSINPNTGAQELPSALVPLGELNFWLKDGDFATYPNPYDYTRYGYYTPFRYDQTLFQEDGSYFKINQVTLGYNLDRDFSRRYGITSMRIYGTVQNVYTFHNYSGPDPELVTALGRDNSGGYPNRRSFTLGLQVQF